MVVSKTQISAENKCIVLGLVFLLQVWGRGVEVEGPSSLSKYYSCLYCSKLGSWSCSPPEFPKLHSSR